MKLEGQSDMWSTSSPPVKLAAWLMTTDKEKSLITAHIFIGKQINVKL